MAEFSLEVDRMFLEKMNYLDVEKYLKTRDIGNAVIQKDGALILPQEVIQRLKLKFGDELFFVAKGGEIAISKLPDAMKRTVDYYLALS